MIILEISAMYLLIFHYALLFFESDSFYEGILCSSLEGVRITCGENTGNKENRCGSCERLGNIEDDVPSRGSVCDIPNWYVLYFRKYLNYRLLHLD